MCKGFMKLSRDRMSDWRWLNNQTKFYVFFRLLLMANFKESLSAILGVSVQTLRTTLRDLQNTNEINIQPTRRYSILTICNYDSWQDENNEANNESTYNQHTDNIQSTLSEESNKGKELKNKEEEKENLQKEKDELFEQCWKAYNRKGSKKKSLEQWKKLKENETQLVLPHVRMYVASRELQYQKDFERYLRDRTFMEVIIRGNQTIYDPQQVEEANVYHPTVDGIFQWWNEERQCLMFNGHVEMINDGYTDETRPDGARAAWNMYEWTWSRAQRQWVKK